VNFAEHVAPVNRDRTSCIGPMNLAPRAFMKLWLAWVNVIANRYQRVSEKGRCRRQELATEVPKQQKGCQKSLRSPKKIVSTACLGLLRHPLSVLCAALRSPPVLRPEPAAKHYLTTPGHLWGVSLRLLWRLLGCERPVSVIASGFLLTCSNSLPNAMAARHNDRGWKEITPCRRQPFRVLGYRALSARVPPQS
jgi:hypothetical protein